MEIGKIKVWIIRSSIVSVAPVVEFGSRFARTVILSRLLARDEFGISVAITVMLGMVLLVSDVALDKFVLIHSDDNGEGALSAGHLLSVIRGLLISSALLVSASASARLFGVPQCTTSFEVAALVPLIGSLAHLGVKQVQRHYDFVPETWSLIFSNLTAILALIIAVNIFGDHRAIVASFLIEAVGYVIASHFFARTRYRLGFSRKLIREAVIFGVPLMLNGIGLALITQVDRALVGSWFGVDALAKYSVLLSVSVVPISVILRVFGTMSLSFILSHTSKGVLDNERCGVLVFLFAALALVYSLFVALTLDWATPLIFGNSFQVDLFAHLLLTTIVFFRLQRGGAPTNVLLATGRTRELALLNLSTAIGLAFALAFLFWVPRFEMLLLGLAVGDMVTLVLFLFVSSGIIRLNKSVWMSDFGAACGAFGLIIGMLWCWPDATVVARMALFGVGITGVVLQIAVGLRNHPSLL